MYNHEPAGYDCPFCRLARGLDTSAPGQPDVVYRDSDVTAFVSAAWWPNNPGHVLVVASVHDENVYDLPPALATPIQRVTRAVAIAFNETYGCGGVSTRQHNEPAGLQEVWHDHQHVFPRHDGDDLYLHQRRSTTPEERRPYATRFREFLARSDALRERATSESPRLLDGEPDRSPRSGCPRCRSAAAGLSRLIGLSPGSLAPGAGPAAIAFDARRRDHRDRPPDDSGYPLHWRPN